MLAAALALAACGGGSGSTDNSADRQFPLPQLSAVAIEPASPWVDGLVTATATCSGVAPLRYTWQFDTDLAPGDGGASSTHIYTSAGARTLRLQCTDALGRSVTQARAVVVDARNLNAVAGRPCSGATAGHGWCRQWPERDGVALAAGSALSANTWWGLGVDGRILRTDDAGAHWVGQAAVNVAGDRAFAAGSERTAWATDSSRILGTTDGGRTWRTQREAGTRPLFQVWAVDERSAWIGGDGVVLRTTDGGTRWQTAWEGEEFTTRTVVALDADEAWVFSPGLPMLHLSDGGAQVESLTAPADLVVAVARDAARSTLWALDRDGGLWRTGKGGPWRAAGRVPRAAGESLRALAVVDAATLWVAGVRAGPAPGALLRRSDDGGLSWTEVTPSTDEPLQAVLPSGPDRAVLLGLRTVQLWSRAGVTTVSERPVQPRQSALHIVDANTAWTVGGSGMVRQTVDGGITWRERPLPVATELNDVWAGDALQAWVVGRAPALYRSSDGGRSWTTQPLPTQRNLRAVARAPLGTPSWIVGDGGTVLRSTDGGTSWQALPFDARWTLLDVLAYDDRTAWLAAEIPLCAPDCVSALFVTHDGGASWQQVALPGPVRDVFRVVQPTVDVVWVLGGIGTGPGIGTRVLWISEDGGTTWRRQDLPAPSFATGLTVAGDTAWLTDSGTVLKSTDGARSWQRTGGDLLRAAQLIDVQALDGATAWAIGRDGTIWKTLTGGE